MRTGVPEVHTSNHCQHLHKASDSHYFSRDETTSLRFPCARESAYPIRPSPVRLSCTLLLYEQRQQHKRSVRYLKAEELIAPEVRDLHRGKALLQTGYMLVFVFALLKDGEKQDFQTCILERHGLGSLSIFRTFVLQHAREQTALSVYEPPTAAKAFPSHSLTRRPQNVRSGGQRLGRMFDPNSSLYY